MAHIISEKVSAVETSHESLDDLARITGWERSLHSPAEVAVAEKLLAKALEVPEPREMLAQRMRRDGGRVALLGLLSGLYHMFGVVPLLIGPQQGAPILLLNPLLGQMILYGFGLLIFLGLCCSCLLLVSGLLLRQCRESGRRQILWALKAVMYYGLSYIVIFQIIMMARFGLNLSSVVTFPLAVLDCALVVAFCGKARRYFDDPRIAATCKPVPIDPTDRKQLPRSSSLQTADYGTLYHPLPVPPRADRESAESAGLWNGSGILEASFVIQTPTSLPEVVTRLAARIGAGDSIRGGWRPRQFHEEISIDGFKALDTLFAAVVSSRSNGHIVVSGEFEPRPDGTNIHVEVALRPSTLHTGVWFLGLWEAAVGMSAMALVNGMGAAALLITFSVGPVIYLLVWRTFHSKANRIKASAVI